MAPREQPVGRGAWPHAHARGNRPGARTAEKKLPIIKKAIRIYNLTPQTDQSEAGWSLGEMVMDDRARPPDEELVESDNLVHVMRQLETMDPREATVLRMRFGLADNEPRTFEGNRRDARADPRARAPDRDGSPRQAGR